MNAHPLYGTRYALPSFLRFAMSCSAPSRPLTITAFIGSLTCASFALFGMVISPPATFGADSTDVFVGGSFTCLGSSRLALFDANNGSWHGTPIAASGVRAVLIRGPYVYLAGDFTTIAGQARNGLARISHDGQLDPAWKPMVHGVVSALAADTDGIFVAGTFSGINNDPRQNLARLTLADGSTDTWKADTNGPVFALALASGNLLVGGGFTTVNDEPHVRIARVAAKTGTVAATFIAAADSDVRAIAIAGEKVFIGGQFSRINAEDRLALARLELDSGDVDPDWRADVDGAVLALSAESEYLYLGGAFTTVASRPRANCARLLLKSGSVDEWQADANEQVAAIVETDASHILVAGRFTTIRNRPAAGLAAVSKATGELMPNWRTQGVPAGAGALGMALREGLLVVASDTLDGAARTGLATLSSHGIPAPVEVVLDGSQIRVMCSVIDKGFRYIGGNFSMAGNQPRLYLARLSLATGEIDAQWRCDTNGPVRTLAVVDQDLLLGGDFTKVSGQPRLHLAKVALANASLQPWNVAVDGSVQAILPTTTGVLITGTFRHIGAQVHHGIASLSRDGSVDPAFTLNLSDGEAPGTGCALAAISEQVVLVGGRFTSVSCVSNGAASTTAVGNITAFNPTTGQVIPWLGATDGPVFALAVAKGLVAVGGGFATLGKTPHARLGVVDATTGAPTPWRVDANLEVRTLLINGDHLWIGGDFTTLNGQTANHLGLCHLSSGQIIPTTGADDRVEVLAK